jgi:signal peptidase I
MKKIIGNILFYGICFLLFFFIFCQIGLLPIRFTYFLSGSMRPLYEPGDLAVVYVGKGITVNPGDVVLFSAPIGPTIHRVVAVENGLITTQGDANNTPDENKIKKVDGLLLFSIPKIGYFFDLFHVLFQSIGKIFASA